MAKLSMPFLTGPSHRERAHVLGRGAVNDSQLWVLWSDTDNVIIAKKTNTFHIIVGRIAFDKDERFFGKRCVFPILALSTHFPRVAREINTLKGEGAELVVVWCVGGREQSG